MEIVIYLAKWLAIAFLLITAAAISGWYSARAYCDRYHQLSDTDNLPGKHSQNQ